MEFDTHLHMNQLIVALQNLAMDPEQMITQIDGYSFDEFAEDLNVKILALPTLVKMGCITSEQSKDIRTLDMLLDEMSGHENEYLWTEEGVRSDERWEAVRELARSIVDSFKN